MNPRKEQGENSGAEREREAEWERQRRKLETLGRLSAHVVHDFNNLLMVIDGYARMLREEAGLSESARESVEEILEATERGAQFTKQLLSFSRKPEGRAEKLDLRRLLLRMKPLLERLLGDAVRLELAVPEEEIWVEAERDQAEQVLLNLIVNARDAMPLGGRIRVEARRREGNVEISVLDTGEGIAPEVLPRIFDAYFTTKEEGRGTGIGLGMVRETVQGWGGEVFVESQVGEGSCFVLRLPAAEGRLTAGGESRKGWILLAEDEAGIRGLIRRVLEQEGFGVLEAATEEEARELAQGAQEIQILVTDLELAQGEGASLAEFVGKLHPKSKIIFISGYAEEGSERGGIYLQKPFSPHTLVLAVQKLLRKN